MYEPIGVDKDGETVSLVDVIEVENKETLETIILKQDIKELYQAFDSCLKDNEKQSLACGMGFTEERSIPREKLLISWEYPDLTPLS